MKNNFQKSTTLSLLIGFALVSCSQKMIEQIEWQTKAVSVDARLDEYPEAKRYLQEVNMFYYISNDNENLYITLKSHDVGTLHKLLMNGLEIGFDSSTKKRMKAVLTFPEANHMPMSRPGFRQAEQAGRRLAGIDRERIPEPAQMLLKGFNGIDDGPAPLVHESGIAAKLQIQTDGGFMYEAAIPFKTFYKPQLDATDNEKAISLTFHLPGIETDDMDRPQGPPYGGGQMGKRNGFDQGGPQQHRGQHIGFEKMSKEIKIKKLFKLSVNTHL